MWPMNKHRNNIESCSLSLAVSVGYTCTLMNWHQIPQMPPPEKFGAAASRILDRAAGKVTVARLRGLTHTGLLYNDRQEKIHNRAKKIHLYSASVTDST